MASYRLPTLCRTSALLTLLGSSPPLLLARYFPSRWVSSLPSFSPQAAVMMVGGMLDSKIGARWTALIGGSLVTLANVLTYWAVDNYLSTIFIYGLLFGLGIGIAYSPCLGAGIFQISLFDAL